MVSEGSTRHFKGVIHLLDAICVQEVFLFMATTEAQKNKILTSVFYSPQPGRMEIRGLDEGDDVKLIIKAKQIRQLEGMLTPKGAARANIMDLIQNNVFQGVTGVAAILTVGSAWQFVGPGAKKKKLSEDLVDTWVGDCEKNGIEFSELMMKCLEVVLGGLPNGAEMVENMNKAMAKAREEEEQAGKHWARPEEETKKAPASPLRTLPQPKQATATPDSTGSKS